MPDPCDDAPPPPLNWDEWLDAARALNAAPDNFDAFQADCQRLYHALIEANRTMNLTRLTAPEDFLRRHALDSLTVLPFIPHGARVADVGSGAGFPALPLALARPDLSVVAIEATGKKCRFIEAMREALALESRLTVVNARSEDLTRHPDFAGRFDVVTARAVAALPKLAPWTLPLLKPGGRLLAIKGRPTARQELTAAKDALRRFAGVRAQIHEPPHDWTAQTAVIILETPL
ncbi:MAG: 16S rRNA (guanine(527)-N(7))-methyltransferase RsmG [Vampirovibrionales bacterium]|nr:16S rRNA (guanine(527)-N(7))-methyltransferase RsmG [Vampirovibrionales bacterium]